MNIALEQVDKIRRNSKDFSFVDAIGSFINNYEFSRGFDDFLRKDDTKKAYIWNVLSSIGNEYAEVIYENVLNYINNVSNVDLCKIKALLSMMKILGVRYDVLESFNAIPYEVAQLIDILSINRSYLTRSDVFKTTFIDELSASGCLVSMLNDDSISSFVVSSDYSLSTYNDYKQINSILDDKKYLEFLYQVFKNVLDTFVYMKYADAENDLSTSNIYIYEYMKDEFLQVQLNANNVIVTSYEQRINSLKTKYNIDKSFNQSKIVDDIENGYDSIENYNRYEQEIIAAEIDHRQTTYDGQKTYVDSYEKMMGYNLTRSSYYRSKKVKEYFLFIENTYNSLLILDDIENAVNDESNAVIQVYDKDVNFFKLQQNDAKTLLSYDSEEKLLNILTNYIQAVAEQLVKLTLEIADIRESLKILMLKNYLKGTFLLVSYIVNEYLKYNISDRYGTMFNDERGVSLKSMLDKSITDGDNIKIIEYYDDTEYFNITTENDLSALNGSTANDKFWDNEFNKIGKDTNDLPLEQIEEFYKKQLKLENRNIDNITEFLSAIFEFGANCTYINTSLREDDMMEYGDFVCYMKDGRKIGDPHKAIKKIEDHILSTNMIVDDVNFYVENGYSYPSMIELCTLLTDDIDMQLSSLITDLRGWISVYFHDLISTANEDLKDLLLEEYDDKLSKTKQFDEILREISANYENLKIEKPYQYYISGYVELEPAYLKDKLSNFALSVTNGFVWVNEHVSNYLELLLRDYNGLSVNLYEQLFELSVWQLGVYGGNLKFDYWPYYSPNFDSELTTVTLQLNNFLQTLADKNNAEALQHILNHYNKLLGYKEEMNRIVDECENAYAKLESFKDAVEAGSGVDITTDICKTWSVWDAPMYKIEVIPHVYTYDDGSLWVEYEEQQSDSIYAWTLTSDTVYSAGINYGDGIEEQLCKLQLRCNYYKYSVLDKKEKGALKRVGSDYADGGFYPCTIVELGKVTYKMVVDYIMRDDGTVKVVLGNTDEEYDKPKYEKFDPAPFGAEPGSKVYPWREYYSTMAELDILHAFNKACVDLPALETLINSELDCLGFEHITVHDSDIDSVKEDASDSYEELISKVDSLDDYIHAGSEKERGWYSLATDSGDTNLIPYRRRLDRILAINSPEPVAYNIRWINVEFYKLVDRLHALLDSDKEYFDTYMNTDADRLDKLILAISSFMQDRDEFFMNEVSSKVVDLSSAYMGLLFETTMLALTTKRDEVTSINDNYSYNLSSMKFVIDPDHTQYADYIISGAYIESYWKEEDSTGLLYWIPRAIELLELSIIYLINKKIPTLAAYRRSMYLLDLAKLKYLAKDLSSTDPLKDKLVEVILNFLADIAYISSLISVYEENYEIYLKYNGTDIGYDPFYNHKNIAYSSYQIHPYLYSFVEKSNIVYPLVNNFYASFSENYEKELYHLGIDNLIGEYGNIINLWKYGMYDFTGYQTLYEIEKNVTELNLNLSHPNIYYTGAFYPPALDAYLTDYEKFILDVQDDNQDSFYHHLGLSHAEIMKIYNLLIQYQDAIREITLRWRNSSLLPALSTEYDIYKYGIDANGNALILYKSYKHLYEAHKDDPNYQPSYNEKKNTPGELWMRIKNHPLAFPAFDVRLDHHDISQYCIEKTIYSKGEDVNRFVLVLNDTFKSMKNTNEIKNLTLDVIGMTSKDDKSYLRCFFDMEFDTTNNTLLLVAPYYTGYNEHPITRMHYVENGVPIDLFSYANSCILVSRLIVEFDSYDTNVDNLIHVYSFCKDDAKTFNINEVIDVQDIVSIQNPGMLYYDERDNQVKTTYESNPQVKYEFIGFAKYGNYTFSIFLRKFIDSLAFTRGVAYDRSRKTKPTISLQYIGYMKEGALVKKNVNTDELQYDIFSPLRSDDVSQPRNAYKPVEYKYANVVALAASSDKITLGYITEKAFKPKDGTAVDRYTNNTTVVNFAEYTSMVESKNDVSAYGLNTSYPRDTALLQTDDSQHINIYNSFDSFIQYVATASFSFFGSTLRHSSTQYFNINTDLGFMPLFPDRHGTSRIYANTALSSKTQYDMELLGPENSDIKFTPVISVNIDDTPYGRVTEDYKEINKYMKYSPLIVIAPDAPGEKIVWELSDMMGDAYELFTDTDDLLSYRYVLFNTSYENMPICKGILSSPIPTDYMYLSSEEYDLLSGQDIIGPNGSSFLDVNMTNHINNIKQIALSVLYNDDTLVPERFVMSCEVRCIIEKEQVIDPEKFRLMVYKKNSLQSYDFYHIMLNANSLRKEKITDDEAYWLSFKGLKSDDDLRNLSTSTGKFPFRDYSGLSATSKMSADLEFKYSEALNINREFPYIIQENINDEIITIINTDDRYVYFYLIDSFESLSVMPFEMERYQPARYGTDPHYSIIHINTAKAKFKDFYNRALQIETTYNMEKEAYESDRNKYGIVLYFNYKNLTNPGYVHFSKNGDKDPPSWRIEDAEGLKHTYLVLKPGLNGRLDIRIDYVYYDKINDNDISYTIVGHKKDIVRSYYIMNVSDSKPKFILSRKPFTSDKQKDYQEAYELMEEYVAGTKFRYFKIAIESNRGGNYISMSKVVFYNPKTDADFSFPVGSTALVTGLLDDSLGVPGCYATNLLDGNTDTKFLGRVEQAGFNVELTFDMKSECLDVEQYTYWGWYTADNSHAHESFMPKSFVLYLSNDKTHWFKVNLFVDSGRSLPHDNATLAYGRNRNTAEKEGLIVIK